MRKSKNRRTARAGQHVQLLEWFQATRAWSSLKPGPRALYIELKRRYNGSNNGQIFLSHRDAAKALNAHRNTIGPWFKELEERGLIHMTQGHCLGPSGIGKTSKWALDELATYDSNLARKEFVNWSRKQKPRTKK